MSPLFADLDEAPGWCDSAPTVRVTSARTGGTLTAPTATNHEIEGLHQVTLTAAAHLTDLDLLALTWAGTVDGAARTVTQEVAVAGGVYLPTDELARLRTIPDTGAALDAIRALRDGFEALAERARGVAYVPRFTVEAHPSPSAGRLVLDWPRARGLVSVTVDGTAVDVAGYELDGRTSTLFGWFGCGEVVVGYTHGHSAPPATVIEACREYVRAKALTASSDAQRNVLAFTNLATGEQYRYGTADWSSGRFTGLMQVDDLLNAVPDERIPNVA